MGSNESADLTRLQRALDDLRHFVDVNDSNLREKINELELRMNDLSIVVHGSKSYRLQGVTERLETLEKLVASIETARRSERDKLKGIQIGLALTGITGLGTLASVLAQILGGS